MSKNTIRSRELIEAAKIIFTNKEIFRNFLLKYFARRDSSVGRAADS